MIWKYFIQNMDTGERLLLDAVYAEVKDRPYALVKYPPEPSYAARRGKPYTYAGLNEPHGSLLRIRYNRRTYYGQILDGDLMFDGKRFREPSPAVNSTAQTHVNGWEYIEVLRPGAVHWVHLLMLRRAAWEARALKPPSRSLLPVPTLKERVTETLPILPRGSPPSHKATTTTCLRPIEVRT